VLTSSNHEWPLDTAELRPALALILALAKADMGVLMLHDQNDGTLSPVLGHGVTDSQIHLFGSHRAGAGVFGRAMTEHRRIRVRDVWRDKDELHDVARMLGFRHLDVLPFFGRDGRVLGAFAMLFRGAHGPPRRATRLQLFCADVVGCLLAHAQEQARADRARERIARTTQAKIQFLARMSHELRTPLQSISGYVDLLRAGTPEPLSPAQERMLDRIAESERILVHVIDDVITFSRLEAGHLHYNIGPVAARDIFRIAQAVVEPLATDRQVRLVVDDCPSDLMAMADPDKLKQILVNLAANAIKFTPGGGEVRLRCREDADWIWFEVADTGPGIAGDQLREIFEPYVQLGNPIVDRFGGSGLGLTISREFASGMSGDLSASSRLGTGSTFTLRLPRYVATAQPGASTMATVEPPMPTRRRSDRKQASA
jgi:signal transduction histidine kinase